MRVFFGDCVGGKKGLTLQLVVLKVLLQFMVDFRMFLYCPVLNVYSLSPYASRKGICSRMEGEGKRKGEWLSFPCGDGGKNL